MSELDWKNYRKKPVVIQAYRTECRRMICTLEGDMVAEPGDWIIKGIKGERYPCKDDIFQATYEPAHNSPTTAGASDASGS